MKRTKRISEDIKPSNFRFASHFQLSQIVIFLVITGCLFLASLGWHWRTKYLFRQPPPGEMGESKLEKTPRVTFADMSVEPTKTQPPGIDTSSILISEKDGAEMILIPAGEFIMGKEDGYVDEKPQRRVFVDAFYIYKYEVTVKQYHEFLKTESGKGHEPDKPYGNYMPSDYLTNRKYENYPIVNVSWEDAQAYCKWSGNRLPTEAEWEKAARGIDGRNYPWGMAWNEKNCNWDDEKTNFSADGYRFTAPVGSYPQGASPFGVHDMAGNVWEWVNAWYKAYPENNYKDPDFGETYRVLRGGSWLRYPLGLRCSTRDFCLPEGRYNSIGFRCARDAQ